MSAERTALVKDQIVALLVYGATPLTVVEELLQGKARDSAREVVRAWPDVFEVFSRGFPASGPKPLWVRLRRTDDGGGEAGRS